MRIAKLNLLLLVLAASSSLAAVPHLVNYQGLLTDSSGTKLDGTFNITFTLYDAEFGGTNLWTEAQIVSVNDGLLQTIFGSNGGNPLDQTDFDPAQVWLGISVEGDPEMTPRRRIISVPYAYKAEVAETALNTSGSSWFVGGNLGDLDAGNGQLLAYPTIEYEYGILWAGNIHRAVAVRVNGPGLVFHSREPFITNIVDPPTKFSYGGILYMKGTISSLDDATTSTSWFTGFWVFDYTNPSEVPIRVNSSYGLTSADIYVRKL